MPWDFGTLDRFESYAGKDCAIIHWYQAWAPGSSPRLRPEWIDATAARGAMPMISWSPSDWTGQLDPSALSLDSILAGNWDDHVRSWAVGLAAHGKPVMLRWGWEMNLRWSNIGVGKNGNTPEKYVAAWRRLRGIFAEEGASNARWVWSPNVLLPDRPIESAFEPFFPGDEYVDWIALDGYNHEPWYGWRPFAQIFDESYRRITALSTKPLMLAEFGCSERVGHPEAKAAWIAETFRQLPSYSRIRASVWFNENKEERNGAIDWRIESSSAAQSAYRSAVGGESYASRWQETTAAAMDFPTNNRTYIATVLTT